MLGLKKVGPIEYRISITQFWQMPAIPYYLTHSLWNELILRIIVNGFFEY